MVTCAEGHLRVDGDVEACALETFVERGLDGALAVHHDRWELAFPDCVPVYCRHKVGGELHVESHTFEPAQKHFEGLGVVEVLLYVAFEERILHRE